MAWTITSEGVRGNPLYGVYSETLTTKAVGNGASNWTSIIDFIPPGVDFTVFANTAATNLSLSTHVELFVAYTRDAAAVTAGGRALRFRSKVTPFLALTAELDTATKVLFRDTSVRGQFAYYFLKVPTGGGSVTMKVVVGKQLLEA